MGDVMSLLDLLRKFFGNGADVDAGRDDRDHVLQKPMNSEIDDNENGDCRCIYCHTDFWYEDHIGLCTSKSCSTVDGFRMDINNMIMGPYNGPRQILLRTETTNNIRNLETYPIADQIKGRSHTCPHCGHRFYFYACPHCRCPVPHLYKKDLEQMIAPAGIVGSGKSVFMTILIHNLMNQPINKESIKVISKFIEDNDFKAYLPNYRLLFHSHTTLPATMPGDVPLPYLLRTTSKLPGEIDKQAYTLWYDFSGETLEREAVTNPILQYFRVARGIFFLVDPTNSPEFVATDSMLKNSTQASAMRELAVIIQISNLIEKSHRNAHNIWKNKLIAVIVNKVDLFRNRETNFFKSDSIVWSPSPHDAAGAFCIDDYNQIKVEVRNYLEVYHPALFGQLQLLTDKDEENIGYFAISSLGHAPHAESIVEPIAPVRITDPFYWMLWKMGQMPASGYNTSTATAKKVYDEANMDHSELL